MNEKAAPSSLGKEMAAVNSLVLLENYSKQMPQKCPPIETMLLHHVNSLVRKEVHLYYYLNRCTYPVNVVLPLLMMPIAFPFNLRPLKGEFFDFDRND